MNDQKYRLSTVLGVILGGILLLGVLVRTFAPGVILPGLGIPEMVLISLLALLTEHYFARGSKRSYAGAAVFSGVSFGLLPFAACFASGWEAVRLGIVGSVVFTVITWLFDSMMDRLSTGPAAKFAPVLSALGLYLACQCFMGFL